MLLGRQEATHRRTGHFQNPRNIPPCKTNSPSTIIRIVFVDKAHRDLSTTTGLRYEAHNSNTDTMNDNSTTRPIQQGIAIGPRVSSLGGTRDQASRDRASSGHESVVTQIYAPRHSNATVSGKSTEELLVSSLYH